MEQKQLHHQLPQIQQNFLHVLSNWRIRPQPNRRMLETNKRKRYSKPIPQQRKRPAKKPQKLLENTTIQTQRVQLFKSLTIVITTLLATMK